MKTLVCPPGAWNSKTPKLAEGCHPKEKEREEGAKPARALISWETWVIGGEREQINPGRKH